MKVKTLLYLFLGMDLNKYNAKNSISNNAVHVKTA